MMKVVQCWDDGVNNDIRLIEILRKYNAKATFNLNPGAMGERVAPVWIPAGEEGWSYKGFRNGHVALKDVPEIYSGFELASHCWRHETLGRGVTDEEWIKAAVDARNFLEDLVQRECRGFAYPCGAYSDNSCRLLRENGFAYGRTVENVDDITKCADPMALATNCHFQSNLFWTKYKQAKAQGQKAFYFWGHSYEMLDSEGLWQQMEGIIRYISEDPEVEWANVVDIAPLIGQ